eukprot:441128_1
MSDDEKKRDEKKMQDKDKFEATKQQFFNNVKFPGIKRLMDVKIGIDNRSKLQISIADDSSKRQFVNEFKPGKDIKNTNQNEESKSTLKIYDLLTAAFGDSKLLENKIRLFYCETDKKGKDKQEECKYDPGLPQAEDNFPNSGLSSKSTDSVVLVYRYTDGDELNYSFFIPQIQTSKLDRMQAQIDELQQYYNLSVGGVKPITLNAGYFKDYTGFTGGAIPCQVVKVGSLIMLEGNLSNIKGNTNYIGELPEGFRPKTCLQEINVGGCQAHQWFTVKIGIDGKINVSDGKAIPKGCQFSLHGVFRQY